MEQTPFGEVVKDGVDDYDGAESARCAQQGAIATFNLEGVIGGTIDYGSGKIADLRDGYIGGNQLEFSEGRMGFSLSVGSRIEVYQSTTDNWATRQYHPVVNDIPLRDFLRGDPTTFNASVGIIFVYEDTITVTNPFPIGN